jgi:hypothetical protein
MQACVLEQPESVERLSHRKRESSAANRADGPATPGVYVPASGLTPVQELARLLGLWEADIEESGQG